MLIYEYGGVWCDATLLFYEKIDFEDLLKENTFFSLNMNCKEKQKLWGKVYPVTYTTFFFAAKKNSYILKAINEAFVAYYKKYDFVIDYFLNDYFFILAMKYKLDNDALNKIPFWNGDPFYLLNKLLSRDYCIDIIELKKIPQKITWKGISLNGVKVDG